MKTYKFRALCTSEICCTVRKKKMKKKEKVTILESIVKTVDLKSDTCPDCHYYLYWERYEANLQSAR